MVGREVWHKANYSRAFISLGRHIEWHSHLIVFLILSSDYVMSFPCRPTIELSAQLDGSNFTPKQKLALGPLLPAIMVRAAAHWRRT
jgi:hypothetical protein